MQIGSIVETVGDFEDLRGVWGLPYPKKGDVLTVAGIDKHLNPKLRQKGVALLRFEEILNLMGVCDKRIDGRANFVELQLPEEIEELLQCKVEHANCT
jgi:hypothetical protein